MINQQCRSCHTDLYTHNVPLDRALRCAVCGATSDVEMLPAHSSSQRGGWQSLTLGLLCVGGILSVGVLAWFEMGWWILALCFGVTLAGLGAVYLGISTLLKMRYQKTSRSVRLAAIGGTVAGGVFGLLLGGMMSVFGSLIGLIAVSTETYRGPEECLPVYRKIAEVEFPAELNLLPYRARRSPLQIGSFDLRDHEDSDASRVWITVTQFPKWMTANRQQFINQLEDEIFERFRRSQLERLDRGIRQWQVGGEAAKVTRLNWLLQADEQQTPTEIIQYYALVDIDQLTFGMVVIYRADQLEMDEEALRRIFASLRPGLDG